MVEYLEDGRMINGAYYAEEKNYDWNSVGESASQRGLY